MLNANDWNLWLSSNETRTALRYLRKELHELERVIIDGYLLKHEQADQIAVDYAHKVGAAEGYRQALQNINMPDKISVQCWWISTGH